MIYRDREQVRKRFHHEIANNSNDDLEIDSDILQYLYWRLENQNNSIPFDDEEDFLP